MKGGRRVRLGAAGCLLGLLVPVSACGREPSPTPPSTPERTVTSKSSIPSKPSPADIPKPAPSDTSESAPTATRKPAPTGGATAEEGSAPPQETRRAATPVPPPTPGSIKSTVKARKVQREKPVGLDQMVRPTARVTVRLTSIRAITAEARLPGEVKGPALAIAVLVDNQGATPISLRNADVVLTDSRGEPALALSAPPAAPLPPEVAADSSVTAVFVFRVARDRRRPVTIEVSVGPQVATAVFRGEP